MSTHRHASYAEATSMRMQRLRSALYAIAHASTPLSRSDIAHSLHVTRATASALVEQLMSVGAITEGSTENEKKGRGRPGVPLFLASGTIVGLGIDINVDALGVVAIDLAGNVVAEEWEKDDYAGASPHEVFEVVAAINQKVLAQCASARLIGATMSLPGLVDTEKHRLLRAPNLGWNNLDQPAHYHIGLPEECPLTLMNEADAAAWSLARRSPGVPGDLDSFLYVSAHRGVGGALVIDGKVHSGQHGWGGEVGHVLVDPAGPSCQCGARGCLEQYVGSKPLMRAIAHDPERAYREAGYYLGVALGSVINVVDVDSIVLGGILTDLIDHIHASLQDSLRTRVLSSPWRNIAIYPAPYGPKASAIGGAHYALENTMTNPAILLA